MSVATLANPYHRLGIIFPVVLVLAAVTALLALWMFRGAPTGPGRVEKVMGGQLSPIRYPATGPLRVDPANHRYFTDGSGRAVYLTGSHTWLTLVDGVLTDPPPAFDYATFLKFMVANNQNFLRMYRWEQAKWVLETTTPYYFSPSIYQRTGPGNALDGKPKFDVTKFNQPYFDRLRARCDSARVRGIYVSIMLFDGWSIASSHGGTYGPGNPWPGHPFNKNNNINGINGDTNNDNSGEEVHTTGIPAVFALEVKYVKKVIDQVNDLDNILYEISNESPPGSIQWQYALIDTIKAYEAKKPKQHPVGMTGDWWYSNSYLYASHADWISPAAGTNGTAYEDSPPDNDGTKIIIIDTDHLWGIGGDRVWVWKSFTRGLCPIFEDQYNDSYKLDGGGYDSSNTNDVSLRQNMGYTLSYANRMNFAAMTPRDALSGTGYCLANTAAHGSEFMVYFPTGGSSTVNLSNTHDTLNAEWFNPASGMTYDGGSVVGGSTAVSVRPPFSGDAALYLYSLPTPVTQSWPPDHSVTTSTVVKLRWAKSRGAWTYHLQVSTDSLFGSTQVDLSNLADTSAVVGPLSNNIMYFWRVQARNSAGSTLWSQPFDFTVHLLVPVLVQLVAPADHAQVTGDSVTCSWLRTDPTVLTYCFEIATDSALTNPTIDSTLVDTFRVVRGLTAGTTYWWKVRANNPIGWGPFSETRSFDAASVSGVGGRRNGELKFALEQNYPNPFNPTTQIRFDLPAAGRVELKVYDILGHEVRTLVDGIRPAGSYSVTWDGRDATGKTVSSGIYLCRLKSGVLQQSMKMLLLH